MFHESSITPAVVVRRCQRSSRCLRSHYKLDDVAAFIINGGICSGTSARKPFRRVALQFPDYLLGDAIAVTEKLKCILATDARQNSVVYNAVGGEETDDKHIRLFVVADNTFGSCCPDEITAQHYHSDCIIHFGDACMSRSTRIPVFYVQEDFRLSTFTGYTEGYEKVQSLCVHIVMRAVTILRHQLKELHQILESNRIPALLTLVIVGCHRSRGLVEAATRQWQSEEKAHVASGSEVDIVWSRFIPAVKVDQKGAYDGSDSDTEGSKWTINGVCFPRTTPNILQYFFFIGPSDATLPIHLLNVHQYNLFHCQTELREAAFNEKTPAVLTILDESFDCKDDRSCDVGLDCIVNYYNDETKLDAALKTHFSQNGAARVANLQATLNKRVRQRVFNVELVRSSAAVGIVVASLAIEGYYETTMLLHKLLRAYGKQAYIIYIGHLNEYKVANFVDTVDCFVVIACPNSREGHFPGKEDGFSKPVVSPVEVLLALQAKSSDSPLFGCPAVFSTTFDCVLPVLREAMQVVEKELTEKRTSTIALAEGSSGGASLIRAPTRALAQQGAAGGALERLYQRSYVGLDPQVGQTPVQEEILQGRHGIARGYTSEKAQQ